MLVLLPQADLMVDEEIMTFEAVEALSGMVCLIAGCRVCVRRRYLVDAAIRKPGDRGTLPLPRTVAASLGLREAGPQGTPTPY